ncbi:MAG TPA: hypothetical protein VGG61_06955 [Gemmataceae bacterium]
MQRERNRTRKQIVGLLGVGLDNQDEHKRLTQSEHFLLVGGSAETHERMQDTAIRFEEDLKRRGKRLQDASVEETIELLRKAQET